jgi:HemK-like putative methylase
VLIEGRPETEAYTSYLAKLLIARSVPGIKYENFDGNRDLLDPQQNQLRILDICTGSGCISHLLLSMLYKHFLRLSIRGVDISEDALKLAKENLQSHGLSQPSRRPSSGKNLISFTRVDIFAPWPERSPFDVVISNPPYVSETQFQKATSRSVRNWEPKLALVPGTTNTKNSDIFYRRIMELERDIFHSKILVMEVGCAHQAARVATMAFELLGKRVVEVWKDEPGPEHRNTIIKIPHTQREEFGSSSLKIPAWGQGKRRAVVIYGRSVSWPEKLPPNASQPRFDVLGLGRSVDNS